MSATSPATLNGPTLSGPSPERQCSANKHGTDDRCKAWAIQGGTICVYHGGKAPQVRDAAKRRLLEMADPALAALSKIVTSSESDAVKLQAAKDILDRCGLGAVQKIESDVHVFDTREELLRKAEEIVERANA